MLKKNILFLSLILSLTHVIMHATSVPYIINATDRHAIVMLRPVADAITESTIIDIINPYTNSKRTYPKAMKIQEILIYDHYDKSLSALDFRFANSPGKVLFIKNEDRPLIDGQRYVIKQAKTGPKDYIFEKGNKITYKKTVPTVLGAKTSYPNCSGKTALEINLCNKECLDCLESCNEEKAKNKKITNEQWHACINNCKTPATSQQCLTIK